jgi:phosphoribosylaminoimidazole-succinocarboxamide synthase
MLVKAAQPVRLECVARGYLFGSAWSDYQETGRCRAVLPRVCARPSGSPRPSSRLPPRPTKATTSRSGDAEAAALVGADRYEELRDLTLRDLLVSAPHAE